MRNCCKMLRLNLIVSRSFYRGLTTRVVFIIVARETQGNLFRSLVLAGRCGTANLELVTPSGFLLHSLIKLSLLYNPKIKIYIISDD